MDLAHRTSAYTRDPFILHGSHIPSSKWDSLLNLHWRSWPRLFSWNVLPMQRHHSRPSKSAHHPHTHQKAKHPDIFEIRQPIIGASKTVLQEWNDADCALILKQFISGVERGTTNFLHGQSAYLPGESKVATYRESMTQFLDSMMRRNFGAKKRLC